MPVYVTPVYLHVGPYRYGLVYVDGYIRWKGQNREALTRYDLQRILISKWLDRDQMVQAIARELSRVWEYHWPNQESSDPSVHVQFAIKIRYLLRDLAVQVVPNEVLV